MLNADMLKKLAKSAKEKDWSKISNEEVEFWEKEKKRLFELAIPKAYFGHRKGGYQVKYPDTSELKEIELECGDIKVKTTPFSRKAYFNYIVNDLKGLGFRVAYQDHDALWIEW